MASRSYERALTELAIISLGSNIEPERNLPRALAELPHLGRLIAVSSAHRNPAVGPEPQPAYLNAAALLELQSPLDETQSRLRDIERELGRVRTADKYAPRTIDLDLVWLSDRAGQPPRLFDPEIAEQAHLAIPVAELTPDAQYPETGESLHSISARLRAEAKLEKDDGVSAELQAVLERVREQ